VPAAKPFEDEGIPHPDRVGRYVLLLPIASGGMGTVYLARTRGLGGFERDVALKLSHPQLRSPEFTVALLDEAVLAGGIRHPNVVSVLDVGEDPHGLYVVMEYVEGDSLSGLARRARHAGTPLPPSVVLRLVDDALVGLHAAHELTDPDGHNIGLVHRDFSPQNILVGIDGLAKLTDFGVAKALGRVSNTMSGAIKGKIGYMSPEQARGDALDRRVDVWAAGVVAWELLSGLRLYKNVSDAVALLKIVSERPPRLRFVRPDIAPELDEVVARALEPDLDKRFQDADSFARELARAARETVGLAERREVAECVAGLLAPLIADRREKVKKIVELKEQMGLLTRLPRARGTPSRAGASDSASFPSMDLGSSPSQWDVPAEPLQTDSISIASTRNARPVPARKPNTRSLLIAAGAVLAAALAAATIALLASAPKPVGPLEHLAWRPVPKIVRPPPPPAAPEHPKHFALRVRANAPVVELTVDGVAHTIDPPRKTFSLDLTRDPGDELALQAESSEGTKTTLTLAADSSLALLKFPAISKGTVTERPKLLPSPYSH
jgi:eukaryotic-like serine/threonine-protein kinase